MDSTEFGCEHPYQTFKLETWILSSRITPSTFKLKTWILSSPVTPSGDYPVQWIPLHPISSTLITLSSSTLGFWAALLHFQTIIQFNGLSTPITLSSSFFGLWAHPLYFLTIIQLSRLHFQTRTLNKLITLSGECPMPWIPLNSISSTSDTFLKLETGIMNTSITVSSDSVQWIPLNSVSSTPISLSC